MATISSAAFRQDHTQIHLNPDQFAHFSEGDGLFIKGPAGETLGFIHEDTFELAIRDLALLERLNEARAKMALISAALTPGQHMELTPQMQMGLALLFDDIQQGMTVERSE